MPIAASVSTLFGSVDSAITIAKGSTIRKSAAELRLRYFQDRQVDDLLSLIRQRWSEPEKFRLFFVNVLRKIVNKRAAVYQRAPVRRFDGWDDDAGAALYAAIGANVTLKKANRLTKLLKTTALQVGWNGARPTLAVIPPHVLDAVWDDPEEPSRIIVTHPGQGIGLMRAEIGTEYSDWTATTFRRLDYRGHVIPTPGNPGQVNPYGVLPFVPLFDSAPDDEFFLPGGDDLIEAQRAINCALVNLWRGIELQSHGQAWAAGLPASDVIRMGPDRTIALPENGSLGFAAPNTPIKEVLGAIDFLIRQTAIANDIAANVFELQPKAESGAAKDAENRDLIESRADDVELWRGYESKLFEVIKRVVNTHTPGAIPEAAALAIDFAEPDSALSDIERLAAYRQRIDLGIWSPVDAMLAENPDIRDRAAALEILNQRREESAALGIGFAGPSFTQGNNP